MLSRAGADRIEAHTEEAQEQDVFGRHGDVRLELIRPPAVGVLMFQKPVGRCVQRITRQWRHSRAHPRRAARPPGRCGPRIPLCRANLYRSTSLRWQDWGTRFAGPAAVAWATPGRSLPGCE